MMEKLAQVSLQRFMLGRAMKVIGDRIEPIGVSKHLTRRQRSARLLQHLFANRIAVHPKLITPAFANTSESTLPVLAPMTIYKPGNGELLVLLERLAQSRSSNFRS
jgi:hypothetical protein